MKEEDGWKCRVDFGCVRIIRRRYRVEDGERARGGVDFDFGHPGNRKSYVKEEKKEA